MSDTTSEQPQHSQTPVPQKGGSPVRPVESGSQPQNDMSQHIVSRRGFLSNVAKLAGGALVASVLGGEEKKVQAINSPVDTAPILEQQSVLTLPEVLGNSVPKADLIKRPANIIYPTTRKDFFGNTTSQHFLVEDPIANVARVASRVLQGGRFADTNNVGTVIMQNAFTVATDGKNTVVGGEGRREDGSFEKAKLEVSYATNPSQFVNIPLDFGQGVHGGTIYEVIPALEGIFVFNTDEGSKILDLGVSSDLQNKARVTSTTVIIKDTNLTTGRLGKLLVPSSSSENQVAQTGVLRYFAAGAANALNGFLDIKLNVRDGKGDAKQLFPQIGDISHLFYYVDEATGDEHMLAANNVEYDAIFNCNITKNTLTFINYYNLLVGNPRFPEARGGGIAASARVGNRLIALVQYGGNKIENLSALLDWDVHADLNTNPELVNIQILEGDVENNPRSMTSELYNGLPALSINLSKIGKVTVPLGSAVINGVTVDNVPDVKNRIYDDAGLQSFSVFAQGRRQ